MNFEEFFKSKSKEKVKLECYIENNGDIQGKMLVKLTSRKGNYWSLLVEYNTTSGKQIQEITKDNKRHWVIVTISYKNNVLVIHDVEKK